jgi:hypothetical protein
MPLLKKNAGKGHSFHLPARIAERIEAFADAGGFTAKSVVETACEEFLSRQEDDGIDEREPTKGPPVKLTAGQESIRKAGGQ